MGFQIDDASSRDIVKDFAVCDEQKALLKKSFLQLEEMGLEKFGFIIFK